MANTTSTTVASATATFARPQQSSNATRSGAGRDVAAGRESVAPADASRRMRVYSPRVTSFVCPHRSITPYGTRGVKFCAASNLTNMKSRCASTCAHRIRSCRDSSCGFTPSIHARSARFSAHNLVAGVASRHKRLATPRPATTSSASHHVVLRSFRSATSSIRVDVCGRRRTAKSTAATPGATVHPRRRRRALGGAPRSERGARRRTLSSPSSPATSSSPERNESRSRRNSSPRVPVSERVVLGRRDRCRTARVGNRQSLAIDTTSRVYAPSPPMDDPSRLPRVARRRRHDNGRNERARRRRRRKVGSRHTISEDNCCAFPSGGA